MQDIKHYVRTDHYWNFLTVRYNWYQEFLKSPPKDITSDNISKLEKECEVFKHEWFRAEYVQSLDHVEIEIPNALAHGFYAFRLEKIKEKKNVQ